MSIENPGGNNPLFIEGVTRRGPHGPGRFKSDPALEPTSTKALASQVEAEVVVLPSAPAARVSQEVIEAVTQASAPVALVSQMVNEVVVQYSGTVRAGVSQVFMEVVVQNLPVGSIFQRRMGSM